VHGFALDSFNEQEGSASLTLDIDFILEWHSAEAQFEFTLCRAELRFENVFGLKMALDYAHGPIGMCPFSINELDLEAKHSTLGPTIFKCRILTNCPAGSLEFETTGFCQRLVGARRRQSEQWLRPEHRSRIDA
jgi:hypothetical protein